MTNSTSTINITRLK